MKFNFKILVSLSVFLVLLLVDYSVFAARLLFDNEFTLENTGTAWVIDPYDDATGDLTLQFGNSLNETINFNTVQGWFEISDDLSLQQHEIKDVALDNLSSPPTTPVAGQIYHNTSDGNTYVYNGSDWEDITALSVTSSKVVTVGTGLDYSDIASAAGYLNSLNGGIMLLSAEVHQVNGAINLSNISLVGKDRTKTVIQLAGLGQLDSFDTRYASLTLDVNAINDDMAVDIQSGSSSIQFEWVDFDIQDSGDSLLDSNSGTAPSLAATFSNCSETGGSGTVFKTIALSNLNSALTSIFISGASGTDLLMVEDWDVIIEGAGNVLTDGVISTIPENTIYVYPGMNIQGAIDSLPGGGFITILPGVHNITEPLVVNSDSIEIVGYGDASIIRQSAFASTGETVGAIQIGAADGSSPVNGVNIKDLKVEINDAIHGIRMNGGEDNKLDNVTVQKISGTSGTGATADMGIQLLDAVASDLIRPVVTNCRVLGNGGSIYFTDGIHVTSDPSLSGVFGNGNRVNNALIEGNNVDYIRETGYVFVGVDDSSLFNNRASRMGGGTAGAYGIYMGNITNINMNANVFSGSLSAQAIAIGVDSFGGATSQTLDSIFNNNVIDGTSDGGLGFRLGFQIGGAAATVHRNSFQSNVVKGASNDTTVAFDVSGNCDDNTISNNDIEGGTNLWDTGVVFDATTQERNLVRGNRFSNVTVNVNDGGAYTKFGVSQHRATIDPTVNDDSDDAYFVGTIWVNTSTDTAFILTDDSVGAAVWEQIDGGGSTVSGVDLSVVQARRTSDYTLAATGTWYDLDLDTTDVENLATVLDHDDVDRDRINVLEDGVYRITYHVTANDSGATHTLQTRVLSNDLGVLSGSELTEVNYNNEYGPTTAVFLAELTAGDYLTLQVSRSTANTVVGESLFTVTKLNGVKGDQGDPGVVGSGTDFETFVIDQDDTTGDLSLQFGATLSETLTWDSANLEFDLSDDLNLNSGYLDDVGNLDFFELTSNPTLEEGKLWFRSDEDNLNFYADGRLQEIGVVEVGQFYDSDGNGGTFNVNAASWVAIPWDSESFVEDATYSHDTVTNNSRVTVNDAGLYLINYAVHAESTGSRRNVRCRVRLNGATFPAVSGDSFSYSRNGTDEWATNSSSALVLMGAGDYYEVVCRAEGTAGDAYLSAGAEGNSYTWIQLIRRS